MRTLPAALSAALETGVTTLATCWRLTRRDGVVAGFTDHDRDLVFDGVTHQARTAFEPTEVTSELGLAVGGGEVAGALSSIGLTDADIEAGVYDGATVDTYIVDWTDLGSRHRTARHEIGEIRRRDGAFSAELRSVAHRLDQDRGRLFVATCDADLGDARCGVPVAGLTMAGTVTAVQDRVRFVASGLAAAPSGRFGRGRLVWTSGPNAGRPVEVKRHDQAGSGAIFEIWRPPVADIVVGQTFSVSPGCDKRFSSCRDVFGNQDRFRGFPHIPGGDAVLGIARQGSGNDGGSLMR